VSLKSSCHSELVKIVPISDDGLRKPMEFVNVGDINLYTVRAVNGTKCPYSLNLSMTTRMTSNLLKTGSHSTISILTTV
jgi:hypothetical protein